MAVRRYIKRRRRGGGVLEYRQAEQFPHCPGQKGDMDLEGEEATILSS